MAPPPNHRRPASAQADQSAGARGNPVDLAKLWRDLGQGRYRCIEAGESAEFLFAIFEEPGRPVAQDAAHIARNLSIVARVLTGESTKIMAFDEQMSSPAISLVMKRTLQAMGFEFPRTPLFAVMAARAFQGAKIPAESVVLTQDGATRLGVKVPRPNLEVFAAFLSPAERAVVQLLLEGRSNEEISSARHTSQRTIANQIRAAYSKLGVRGRGEVLHRLLREQHPTAEEKA